MENRWNILKVVALVLVAILVSCVSFKTHAQEKPNLTDGGMQITPYIPCAKDDKVYMCVGVEWRGKKYLVIHDEHGEYIIYEVTEAEPKLVWARNMV